MTVVLEAFAEAQHDAQFTILFALMQAFGKEIFEPVEKLAGIFELAVSDPRQASKNSSEDIAAVQVIVFVCCKCLSCCFQAFSCFVVFFGCFRFFS